MASYIEKITQSGTDYRRVNIYVERPVGRGRNRKSRPSSDAQKRLNRRNAETRLSDIIHNNFTTYDFAVRLDYNTFIARNDRNPTEKEARAKMVYYLGKLKKIYTTLGVEFKYIYSIEVGARSGKVHHHLIISGSPDKELRAYLRDAIESNWRHGYCNTQALKFDENGVKGLAHYFTKDDLTAKRWVPSHGLIRPSEENGLVEMRRGGIKAKDARHIDEHPNDVAFLSDRYPGWITAEVRTTGQAQLEDAREYDVPDYSDPGRGIVNGLVMPDYGGVFIELWQFREDAEFLQSKEFEWLRKKIKQLKNERGKEK